MYFLVAERSLKWPTMYTPIAAAAAAVAAATGSTRRDLDLLVNLKVEWLRSTTFNIITVF